VDLGQSGAGGGGAVVEQGADGGGQDIGGADLAQDVGVGPTGRDGGFDWEGAARETDEAIAFARKPILPEAVAGDGGGGAGVVAAGEPLAFDAEEGLAAAVVADELAEAMGAEGEELEGEAVFAGLPGRAGFGAVDEADPVAGFAPEIVAGAEAFEGAGDFVECAGGDDGALHGGAGVDQVGDVAEGAAVFAGAKKGAQVAFEGVRESDEEGGLGGVVGNGAAVLEVRGDVGDGLEGELRGNRNFTTEARRHRGGRT
jgi:hypothetical protein